MRVMILKRMVFCLSFSYLLQESFSHFGGGAIFFLSFWGGLDLRSHGPPTEVKIGKSGK